jgi:hypothetical protein
MEGGLEILAIAPRIPPAVDGVGDYAATLAIGLEQQFGIQTKFLTAHTVETHQARTITPQSSQHLAELLKHHSIVLLHYVGYGYSKRGCPYWLVAGLARWKARNPQAHLATMFHEVYASSRFLWHSAFWLSPMQRHLAQRLAQISDRLFTNRDEHAHLLQQFAPGTPITVLPVLSNVGEITQLKLLKERSRHLVIFGGCTNRTGIYRDCFNFLERVCQHLSIERILDIGPAIAFQDSPSWKSQVSCPIEMLGVRSPQEISTILANSLAGLVNYSPDYLAKSGIFAAYCAHGMLPINAQMGKAEVDGIFPGKHYWCPDKDVPGVKDWSELEAIATNAHAWYQHHCLTQQTKCFANALPKSS